MAEEEEEEQEEQEDENKRIRPWERAHGQKRDDDITWMAIWRAARGEQTKN